MLPGIIITLATIAFLLWKIDLSQTYQALLKVEFWRLGVAVVLLVLAFISRAMAWRTSLQGQVSLNKAFSTEVIGYLLNTVLPFRLGEVGRAVAMANNTPLTFWEVFPTLVIERVFDLGILAGLLFGTLPFLVGAEWATSAAVFAGVLVGLGFIVMYGMVLKPDWVLGVFKWLTGKWPRLQQFGQGQSRIVPARPIRAAEPFPLLARLILDVGHLGFNPGMEYRCFVLVLPAADFAGGRCGGGVCFYGSGGSIHAGEFGRLRSGFGERLRCLGGGFG